jgi:hypothetical protein
MTTRVRRLVPVLCLVVGFGAAQHARAQADPQNFLFNSGQTIQPFFEGWAHNPDGSFEMHFGYLNRNYVEELHVPIGADNRIEPAGPDRGQPSYFYPRVNDRVFSITVPADWGDRRLVWQLTLREETYRAEGWLQPEWEIAAASASRFAAAEGAPPNQSPTLAVEAARTVAVTDTLMMTATVTDDGLPEPRQRGGGGANTPPSFAGQPEGPTLPLNVPQVQTSARKRPIRTRVERVNVTWTQLRGPVGVTVEAQDDSPDGVAAVTATFESPGEYLFRVQASDNLETATDDVSVTVQ